MKKKTKNWPKIYKEIARASFAVENAAKILRKLQDAIASTEVDRDPSEIHDNVKHCAEQAEELNETIMSHLP